MVNLTGLRISGDKGYKLKTAFNISVLFILTILFFWYFIFDVASFGGDGAYLWYPHLSFIVNSIRNGQLPLWNPFDFSGRPCIGDTFAGVFYPFFWPLILFVKNNVLSFLAMEYIAIFHVFLTGLFTYFFARVLNFSPFGSLVSAIIYMFCGNVFGAFDSPPAVSVTWLPFILLFLQKSLDTKDYNFAVFSGIGFGLTGLYIHPIINENPSC